MFSKVIMYRLNQFCKYRHGCSKYTGILRPAVCTSHAYHLQVNRALYCVDHAASGDNFLNKKALQRMAKLLPKLLSKGHPLDVYALKSTLQENELFNEEYFPYFILKAAMMREQTFENVEKIVKDLDSSKFDIPELAILIHIYDRHKANDLVISTYERMCEISDGVFDHATLKTVVKALAGTSKWRECFRLLDLYLIIKPNISMCFDFILAAAANEGDFQMFCDILIKMDKVLKSDIQSTEQILPVCFSTFVNPYLLALERGVEHFTLENLFFLMRKFKFYINERNIQSLITQLNRSGYMCHTGNLIDPLLKYPQAKRWNQVPRCEVCNLDLNKQELTSEEFEDLQNAYFTQDGINVYLKNNPVESKLLKNLICLKGPFDVVVDHLNACFDGGRLKPQVSVSILKQLKSRGLNCLVVTRKRHYKIFPDHLKEELEKCATIFISKSESLDDLIVLDATFHSGINTMLLSNDKFHDHACQLGSKMQQAFWRWQRCRQILRFHSSRGDILMHFPESPDVFVQESEDGWHIPYGTNSFYFSDKKVLCVRKPRNMKVKV